MYSKFQLAKKFLHYYFTSSNGKGHGVHSPFVFDFITHVLNDKKNYESYDKIEKLRKQLQQDETVLTIEDFGAGSRVDSHKKRKVSAIANTALKPKKFGQLLFRVVKYYQPKQILELGTSLGVTTSYLAAASENAQVITMEGASEVATVAKRNFDTLSLKNIHVIQGNFDNILPSVIKETDTIDLAFIDGNHRKEPTLQYFHQLLQVVNEHSILIFDDIHWSAEMEEAWEAIKKGSSVTLTIDLFFIGLVFFRKGNKVKQNFSIRF